MSPRNPSSLRIAFAAAAWSALILILGCMGKPAGPDPSDDRLELVWGRRGISDGLFQKPRAMTIDNRDQLYIVDMLGRVQVFDTEGKFLRVWRTPAIESGKPTGMGIDRQGLIMVADTHYFRVLFYTPEGEMLEERTIGGVNGKGPGEFGFVTDVVQDSQGNYFVSEYGEFDRIQKFTSTGEFICQFGRHGDQPLEFNRPQNIFLDDSDQLWIADACNHRIQVIKCPDTEPTLIAMFGEQGDLPGQFRYPYDLLLDRDGNLIVCEFGSHRVQKLTPGGKPIASWGRPGKQPGELNQPWAVVEDSRGRLHVLDTMNHRMQRISLKK